MSQWLRNRDARRVEFFEDRVLAAQTEFFELALPAAHASVGANEFAVGALDIDEEGGSTSAASVALAVARDHAPTEVPLHPWEQGVVTAIGGNAHPKNSAA